ncbi:MULTISPECIES: HAD family hydrolase [Kordiimonas]|jgi:hypothetical protein|uniref:sulfotransferase-like domain-containing protein n=1 Tax=Kordiimonas TaxID=288021 RepID=UPI00257E4092|nr:HAD family hydrolase [Kordiimonas sp. UBA4487]
MTDLMTGDIIRIAMWSGPRNISTAMMRSFENRADTMVVDEPFYAAFLKESGLDHPGRDLILKEQPISWQAVVDDLLAPLPTGKRIFYQKHMCHHMLPSFGLDWTDDFRNAFLVRDPRHILASYVKSRPDVTLEDLGVERQLEIFRMIADREGKAPPVIDTAEVQAAPKETLTRLCAALDIPFDAAMLSWPKGPRDSDGVWASWWYAGVEQSTGFAPPNDAARTAEFNSLDDDLKRIADAAMPIYEEMSRYRV